MILSKKRKNGFLALGLALGVFATSVVSPVSVSVLASEYSVRNVLSDTYLQTRASAVEEDLTLTSVRAEAQKIYKESKKALDLDLSKETFDGSKYVDYATNTETAGLEVLNNLAKGTDDQTVIVRFKTSSDGLIFGAGIDTNVHAGNNMTLAVKGGRLRIVLRNKKTGTDAPDGTLKGVFGSGLADGNWHTVAISFVPSSGYKTDNLRIVVDGGADLYSSTVSWGNTWKTGFNQGSDTALSIFQVGGGDYTKNNDYATAAFNGTISSLTVINKAYTVRQLQDITSKTSIIGKTTVREDARAAYTNKTGFDLDLSDKNFDGTTGIDYSSNNDYMSVLQNLKTTKNDQTIVLRFKTTTGGLLFGAGADTAAPNGKNMTLAIIGGRLRVVLRNKQKSSGAPAGGLKGTFGSGLADGNWHTVAISFAPSKDYTTDNVRLVVDGGEDLYATTGWGNSWKAGFNQGENADYTQLQIGGGSYVGVNKGDYASANFNGKIDFVAVVDKAYEIEELKSITYEKLSQVETKLAAMRQGGTGKTWLFTGGTEAVADFKNSSTVRNWVALFEDTMRNGGSYIERGRFVFNTAKRSSDVASILAAYDTQIAAYNTEAVAIEVGASDYTKGQNGLEAFKKNLKALIDKINAADKLAVVVTPYASKDSSQSENVTLYCNAIKEVASDDAKIVDFSSIAADKINADGTLTPDGHQAAANIAKNTLGFGTSATSYNFNLKNLAAGSYTVQKKESAGNVTASVSGSTLQVKVPVAAGSTANLTYTLKASDGQTVTGKSNKADFAVTGLKADETYTLTVNDISRTDKVTESYKPVSIKFTAGSTSTVISEKTSTTYDFSDLLTAEKGQTYLFMGDSITHGISTRGYDNVPQLFAKYLDEIGRKDDVVINTGVSNATLATTLAQIETRLTRYKPDVAVIMLGTNDCAKNGQNTVNANGTGSDNAITVQEFKDRYKELIRKIHDNNENTRIVLRVPCEMINYGQRKDTYHSFFAAIPEVASEIKTEIPDLKIAVVDHLADWNYYHDNVRNDNLANIEFSDTATLSCGWFVDGLHPSGRGNVEMFQQIIKELNIYKADSELANFSYVLSDWKDTSSIKATATQKEDQASLPMSQLSSYTNGLRDVTLTLIAPDGTEISKTADYDANGTVSLNTLDAEKTYTIRVAGTDKTNSKQVTFSSELKKDTSVDPDPNPTPDTKCTCDLSEITLADTAITLEANETSKSVKLNPAATITGDCKAEHEKQIAYTYKVTEGTDVVSVAEDGTVTNKKESGTAKITVTASVTKKDGTKITKDKVITVTVTKKDSGKEDPTPNPTPNPTPVDQNVQKAQENVKRLLAQADELLRAGQGSYDDASWRAFTAAYEAAKKGGNDVASLQKLADALTAAQSNLTLKNGTAVTDATGVFTYKVTGADTVEVTGITEKGKKKAAVKISSTMKGNGKTYKITSVAANALKGNKKMTSLTIGNNVVTIGKNAFANCTKLKKVTVNGNKLKTIGKNAFSGDKKLKTINMKKVKSLKTVGKSAFKGISKKVTVKVPGAKKAAYRRLFKKGGIAAGRIK